MDFIKHWANRKWERLFAWHPSLTVRILLSCLIAFTGFWIDWFLYNSTGTYFTFVLILTVVAISLFAEVAIACLNAVILSLLADYYFIPPVGGIFEDRKSIEHFCIVVGACLVSAFVISSLRYAFQTLAVTKKEAELAKLEAEDANSTKSTFLANMSHEIRTPLGAVIGFAELLGEKEITTDEKLDYISAIKRNGDLLANIINDILDLSRVEAGRMVVERRDIALTEILTDTKMLLDLQAKEKGIELNVLMDKAVQLVIKTDPFRLRQILINIVGNAIKFTDKGSVNISLKPVPEKDGSSLLEISVKDTGRGIEQDQIGKLFAPFSQVHTSSSSKRKYGGTGLGLILSKRLANLLGGDVRLEESEAGRGSTFIITIDPGPRHGNSHATQESLVQLSDGPLLLRGIKVLLADDSPDNQFLISRVLEIAGAEVELASDGQEAVTKALCGSNDIVLMDLQMPVMTGLEATAELRKLGYRGKIIALTAHALNIDRIRCLENGFDGHLGKPIDRPVLIQEIVTLLSRTSDSLL